MSLTTGTSDEIQSDSEINGGPFQMERLFRWSVFSSHFNFNFFDFLSFYFPFYFPAFTGQQSMSNMSEPNREIQTNMFKFDNKKEGG